MSKGLNEGKVTTTDNSSLKFLAISRFILIPILTESLVRFDLLKFDTALCNREDRTIFRRWIEMNPDLFRKVYFPPLETFLRLKSSIINFAESRKMDLMGRPFVCYLPNSDCELSHLKYAQKLTVTKSINHLPIEKLSYFGDYLRELIVESIKEEFVKDIIVALNKQCSNLRVCRIHRLEAGDLVKLCRQHKEIEKLELGEVYLGSNYSGMRINCPNLTRLKIEEESSLHNIILPQSLRHLDIKCKGYLESDDYDSDPDDTAVEEKRIERIDGGANILNWVIKKRVPLKSLTIRSRMWDKIIIYIPKIPDVLFELNEVISSSLEELCIVDFSLGSCWNILRNCSALTTLELDHILDLDDLDECFQHLPNLTSLDVRCSMKYNYDRHEYNFVYNITSTELYAIAKHCSKLTHLDISGAKDLDHLSVIAVMQNCKSLTSFSMENCYSSWLYEEAVREQVKLLPNLSFDYY